MTEKRMVWQRADGTLAILIPAPNGRREGESEEQWLTRITARAMANDTGLAAAMRLPDTTSAELPTSWRFRNCWRADGDGRPAVEMALARAQRLEEIRAERDKRLAVSDGPMARANETGTPPEIQALKQYRQALRDVPSQLTANNILEGLTTPEELEGFEPVWPE